MTGYVVLIGHVPGLITREIRETVPCQSLVAKSLLLNCGIAEEI